MDFLCLFETTVITNIIFKLHLNLVVNFRSQEAKQKQNCEYWGGGGAPLCMQMHVCACGRTPQMNGHVC